MAEIGGANLFAYAAILAWPLVALIFYSNRPFTEATAWTVVGALLFLPSQVAIKFEMIPAIDKSSIASLSIVICGTLFAARQRRSSSITVSVAALAAIYIISPVVTSALNNDLVVAGPRIIPGVGYYDGISALLSQAILFVPFFVGRRYLDRAHDTETLLRVLVLSALIYSIPMLVEIRLSPQLSAWIYGTSSAATSVEMRYGGFRPVVFMINGLAAAFFLSTAVLSATAFWRARAKLANLPSVGVSAFLGVVLVLCKSAGALVYGLLFGVLVKWAAPKTQMNIAVVLAAIAIAYPMLRIYDVVPTRQILEIAATFNQERAESLKVRFDQEQQLLSHASERFWFGWGRYGRSRVYDQDGKDISITDGQWIVTFGQFGFFGFIAQFGLLTFPVFLAARTLNLTRHQREASFLCCLALIVALTVVEQLPNASLNSWSWLLAGALLAKCTTIRAHRACSKSVEAPRSRKSAAPAKRETYRATMLRSHDLAVL